MRSQIDMPRFIKGKALLGEATGRRLPERLVWTQKERPAQAGLSFTR
jgi:hypothetical protein